jgi:zinc transporter ZupT
MLYVLPFIAVAIGYFISRFIKPGSSAGFQLLLSFSGAFLLSVTVFELLPDVFNSGVEEIGIFIMGGLLLQIFLEFLSKGVEHGHMHHHEDRVKFPFLLLFSLSLHALLEGFPLSSSDSLLHGVVIHKIPVAAILSTFLLHSKIGKFKSFLFLSIFALMTPLGSWINSAFEISSAVSVYMSAIVIGIFLHVSTTILFEASKNHSFNASKLAVVVLGIILAYLL